MGQKRNSKWRSPPLELTSGGYFLTHSRLSTVDFNDRTKFGADISIGG